MQSFAYCTLRAAGFRVAKATGLHYSRVKPLPYQAYQHSITHPVFENTPQVRPIHGVEKLSYI